MSLYPETHHARRAWLDQISIEHAQAVVEHQEFRLLVLSQNHGGNTLDRYRETFKRQRSLEEILLRSDLNALEARPGESLDAVQLGSLVVLGTTTIIVGGWCESGMLGSIPIVPYTDFQGSNGILGHKRGHTVRQRQADEMNPFLEREIKDIGYPLSVAA